MTQHKRVVRDVLNHLYGRIDNPLASDVERLRIATKALDQMESDEAVFDVDGSTIAQVQAAVEGGQIGAQAALDAERRGKSRTTLIEWLGEQV